MAGRGRTHGLITNINIDTDFDMKVDVSKEPRLGSVSQQTCVVCGS